MGNEHASSNATFHAFEEWWALVGSAALAKAQDAWQERGIEVDAWFAGAQWMRGECERIATEYREGLLAEASGTSMGAIIGASAVFLAVERIKAFGVAQ